MADVGLILKHFESPDETRRFPLGTFELVQIGGITIGRPHISLDGGGRSM